MSWTDETWLRTAFGALKDTLEVDQETKRQMIQFLLDEGFWDIKPGPRGEAGVWDSAVARFNSCLNPHKPEFFKIGEVWALMKRFNRHQLFLALADDLGYRVTQVPTEERRQATLQRLAEALERNERELASARADLQRLDLAEPPAPRGGATIPPFAGRFSIDRAGESAEAGSAVEREGCP